MNTLNDWCRMASLICLIVLGIEGFMFGRDVAAQVRLSEATPVVKHSVLQPDAHQSLVTR